MLPRLVLLLAQLWVGWEIATLLLRYLPQTMGQLRIFVFALIAAIVVWLLGHLGALVLKDTAPPSSATLTFVLLFALIGAVITLIEPVTRLVSGTLRGNIQAQWYPMIGAVLGYLIKR
ncbi:MAG: hypothetical protein RL291_2108 [Pseudomonadota bacterium]